MIADLTSQTAIVTIPDVNRAKGLLRNNLYDSMLVGYRGNMQVHGRAGTSPSPTELRWLRVLGTLNEYQARLFVADRAIELGRRGVSRLARLTGMSRVTITKGVRALRGRKRLKAVEA